MNLFLVLSDAYKFSILIACLDIVYIPYRQRHIYDFSTRRKRLTVKLRCIHYVLYSESNGDNTCASEYVLISEICLTKRKCGTWY